MTTKLETVLSEIYHTLAFTVKRTEMSLDAGMLIISIDVDVGCKELGLDKLGSKNVGVSRHFSDYSIGETEERALPLFTDLFDRFEMPVTFALRGQLTEQKCQALDNFQKLASFHDIGAHGYYHRRFSSLSAEEADDELTRIDTGMREVGIVPKSFVFPRNDVDHLPLLEKHGYKCYRGFGNFRRDMMYICKNGSLFNICPSICIERGSNHRTLERILDLSIARKLPFHMWFHLWSFGTDEDSIRKFVNMTLSPLLAYAKPRVQQGVLTYETMASASGKVKERESRTPH